MKQILIVEDEPEEREILDEFLKKQYNLLFAETGQQAVDIFKEKNEEIDLILLDINLPDFSAFDVYKKFCELTVTGIPNIIMVTAYNRTSDVVKTLTENYAFYHLEKPYSKKAITSIIEKAFISSNFIRKQRLIAESVRLDRIVMDRNFKLINERLNTNMKFNIPFDENESQSLVCHIKPLKADDATLSNVVKLFEDDTGIKTQTSDTKSILIVEDEEEFSTMLYEFLEEKNYNVDRAFTIQSAKQEIEKNSYDIILLDIGLPDGSGEEIIDLISFKIDNQNYKQPTIIVLSAFVNKEIITKVVKSGADTFLSKPISFSNLESTIKNLSNKKQSTEKITHLSGLLHQQSMSFRGKLHELNCLLSTPTISFKDISQFLEENKVESSFISNTSNYTYASIKEALSEINNATYTTTVYS
ncbi:response regulator [bacterium]|nr:response regulator [bacterium]